MDNNINKPTILDLNAENQEIVLFRTDDEQVAVDVIFAEETVWLTQEQICQLYDKAKSTISEHIAHVFSDGELERDQVVRNFRTTAADGKTYNVTYYNLDVIISVGYRVKSVRGTRFRQQRTLSSVEQSFFSVNHRANYPKTISQI